MEQKAQRFFQKEQIQPDDILYFVRRERKTILSLRDGTHRETYLPVKCLLSALPSHQFLNITKGVVVSTSAIRRIQRSHYIMIDGQQFEGRKRGAGEHKLNRHRLESGSQFHPAMSSEQSLAHQCAVLDRSPMACCLVHMVTDPLDHSVDFLFRYCNPAMLDWEDRGEEELINHSFHDFHRRWNHRWVAICSDVALHGLTRVVEEYDQKHQCPVTIYCYQPMEHYCLCCLIPGKVTGDADPQ